VLSISADGKATVRPELHQRQKRRVPNACLSDSLHQRLSCSVLSVLLCLPGPGLHQRYKRRDATAAFLTRLRNTGVTVS
jgi:hypothetical protein